MRDQAQAVHDQRMRMCKPAPAGSKAGAPVERLVVADGLCPGPHELVYGQSSVTGKHIHLHRLDPFDIRGSTRRRVAHRVYSGGPARLVVMCGPPGSGKTTLARRLAVQLSAVSLSPDEWMTQLGVELDR